jgi:hypothetical protein
MQILKNIPRYRMPEPLILLEIRQSDLPGLASPILFIISSPQQTASQSHVIHNLARYIERVIVAPDAPH